MTRIPDISIIRIIPRRAEEELRLLRCAGGQARWSRELASLILIADVIDQGIATQESLQYLTSQDSNCDLEIGYPDVSSNRGMIVTRFINCTPREMNARELPVRPECPVVKRCQMAIRTEQCAPPDDATSARPADPAVPEPPPSLS